MAHHDLINTLLSGAALTVVGFFLGWRVAMRVFQSRMRKGSEPNRLMPAHISAAYAEQERAAQAFAAEMLHQHVKKPTPNPTVH